MRKRILFVDDEVNLLEGLKRMLRSWRHEWDMEFVNSGPKALESLSKAPFDVIVADMRMPGMTGPELLKEVRKRYPNMIRFMLSGTMDTELTMTAVAPTHQYIAKPCDPETLKSKLVRTFTLRDTLKKEKIRALVSKMESLPSLPALYVELVEKLQSENASMKTVGEIISKDVGMTAKLLQLVNSAFFGLQVQVSSPAHAAQLLGLDVIKSLVLLFQMFSQFEATKFPGLSLARLMNHSQKVGVLAKRICEIENQDQKMIGDAMIGGILHDAGKLVLAKNFPEQYCKILTLSEEDSFPNWQAEREIFEITHAEVGAYLLGIWGLPESIVETVLFHHCPAQVADKTFSVLAAVYVANALDHELSNEEKETDSQIIDLEYLTQIGLTDRLELWREACRETAQKGSAL